MAAHVGLIHVTVVCMRLHMSFPCSCCAYETMYETSFIWVETRLCMRLCCAFILFHVIDYIYHLYVLAYDGL
jgi:hypothetical protein